MSIVIQATERKDLGKGSSRRLRHEAKVPAVVYGAGEPQAITLIHKDFWKAQESEKFYSSVLSLEIDGKATDVIIKDLQRHPAKQLILHADFQRADAKTEVIVNVPIHYKNAAASHGVKLQGGSIHYLTKLVSVKCLAANLPAFIELDLINMKAGEILHLSDLTLPENVVSTDLIRGEDYDLPLVQLNATKGKG